MVAKDLACYVAIQHWFEKRRLLANGIAASGSGLGMFLMGPLVQFLISFYGLHGTFLILSAICLNGVALGMMIPANFPENDSDSDNSRSMDSDESQSNENTAHEKSPLVPKEAEFPTLRKNFFFYLFTCGSALNFTVVRAVSGKCVHQAKIVE